MRRYFGWREGLIVSGATIIYAMVLGPRWPHVVFWSAPAILASLQLFWFGTYLPHRAGPTPFTDRHNARSSRMSDGASLLTCFHFGGYHHEHHLSPGAPWWRLPAVRGNAAKLATKSELHAGSGGNTSDEQFHAPRDVVR
jgi:beta-carotene ketolase (CrtW type)